ncbi:MAG: phage holin family protein [Balneolaceae bacterium]
MSDYKPGMESKIREIIDDVRSYVEKRLELFVLTITERVTFMLADAIQRIVGIFMLAGGIFFLWFAFSFYLSELIGSYSLGFLAGSLPLLIAGLVFVKLQPALLTRKIQDGMLKQFLDAFDSARKEQEGESEAGHSRTESENRPK